MKATQLEQMTIDYTFALNKINESKLRLEQSRNVIFAAVVLTKIVSSAFDRKH
jgi:hypothetical protein